MSGFIVLGRRLVGADLSAPARSCSWLKQPKELSLSAYSGPRQNDLPGRRRGARSLRCLPLASSPRTAPYSSVLTTPHLWDFDAS